MPTTFPNLRALAQDFLPRPYGEGECWKLVVDLLRAGGLIAVSAEPEDVLREALEVWWQDDPRDPLTLVQPWDWALLRRYGTAVGHVGLFVDPETLVHVHPKAGVSLEPLRRMRPRLMQIARLRHCW